jgi:5-methylcytosine-specific restriction endonuclease McrA
VQCRGRREKKPPDRRLKLKARRRFFNPESQYRSGWARYMRDHPERAKFYQSGPWKIARDEQLREEPDCRVCGEPATHVDHIVPIAEGGEPLNADNLQSLCKRHHGPKTLAESHEGMKRAARRRREEQR